MVNKVTKPLVDRKEEKFRKENIPDVNKIVDKKLLCTSCNISVKPLLLKGKPKVHPFMDTLLCDKCFAFFGDGDFSTDEDGSDKYCRWCGQGGTLYLCSKCTAGFCKRCIKRNLPRAVWKEVDNDDWKCLCCNVEPLYELRAQAWAALEYVKATFKEKNDMTSRKRKAKVDSDSDSEPPKKSKKSDDEEDEEETTKAPRKSSRDKSSKKKSKGAAGDGDSSSEEEETAKAPRKSSRDKSSKKKSKGAVGDRNSSNEEEEETAKASRKSPRDRSSKKKAKGAAGDGDSSNEEEETAKASRKSPRDRNSKKKSKGAVGDSSDEDGKSKKMKTKQFKLARAKLSTLLTDVVKVMDVTKRKAEDFKKKKVTVQKIKDVESVLSMADNITTMLVSVEGLSSQLRESVADFTTKFEQTIQELQNGLEEKKASEENGELDTSEKKDETNNSEGEKEDDSKKDSTDVEMKEADDGATKEADDSTTKQDEEEDKSDNDEKTSDKESNPDKTIDLSGSTQDDAKDSDSKEAEDPKSESN